MSRKRTKEAFFSAGDCDVFAMDNDVSTAISVDRANRILREYIEREGKVVFSSNEAEPPLHTWRKMGVAAPGWDLREVGLRVPPSTHRAVLLFAARIEESGQSAVREQSGQEKVGE